MIRTQQTIQDYQDAKTNHPKWSENAIEDYQGLKSDVDRMLRAINDGALSPQSGSGSPEGIIYANYSLKYIDTDVPTEYFNPTFNAQIGWIAL